MSVKYEVCIMLTVDCKFIGTTSFHWRSNEVTYVILSIFILTFKTIHHDLCLHNHIIVATYYSIKKCKITLLTWLGIIATTLKYTLLN